MANDGSRIRRRPVTFGNPGLGTYDGCVYTFESVGNDGLSVPSDATRVAKCAAMVDVPPEQCPEGVLTFARSHRPYIEHVRILITAMLSEAPENLDQGLEAKTIQYAASLPIARDHEVGEGRELSTLDAHEEDGSQSRTYVILFQLSTEKAANMFVQDLHQKPYTSLDETQISYVHRVAAISGHNGVDMCRPFFAASLGRHPTLTVDSTNSGGDGTMADLISPSSLTEEARSSPQRPEVHNCAVCLEDMDVEQTSILTTVCNHSFHLDCLLQWQDSPCPVCRYDHSGLNEALSQCHVCATTENNYVCLICGVVSCGGTPHRRRSVGGTIHTEDSPLLALPSCQAAPSDSLEASATSEPSRAPQQPMSHARQHYDETLHAYALDTETQHVWDFCGQGYVHRLLQNAKDGKLVEVNDPYSTSQERSLSPGLSDAQEEEVMHRKLESFASQYYALLKGQLEQQRIFYERRLEEVRREYGPNTRKKSVSAGAELISALKQERHQLAQRCMSLRRRYEKASEDVAFLKNMNESLTANKAPMKRQIADAQKSRTEARGMVQQCLPPLEEQVHSLMLQLEESINDDGGGKEEARPNDGKPSASREDSGR